MIICTPRSRQFTRGSALPDEQIKPPLIFEQVYGLRKVRPLQADPVAVQHLVAWLDARLCGQSSGTSRLDKNAGSSIWTPTDRAAESLLPLISKIVIRIASDFFSTKTITHFVRGQFEFHRRRPCKFDAPFAVGEAQQPHYGNLPHRHWQPENSEKFIQQMCNLRSTS